MRLEKRNAERPDEIRASAYATPAGRCSKLDLYQYVIINDDVDRAFTALLAS